MIAVFTITIIGFFFIGFIYGYRYGRDKRIQIEDEEMEFLELEQTDWIPIKTRPWTAEDKEEMQSRLGEDLFDDDGVVYDCELPDDAEEVEVTTRYGDVTITTFYNDYNYGSYFENYEDYDDILAWRRITPYRKEINE